VIGPKKSGRSGASRHSRVRTADSFCVKPETPGRNVVACRDRLAVVNSQTGRYSGGHRWEGSVSEGSASLRQEAGATIERTQGPLREIADMTERALVALSAIEAWKKASSQLGVRVVAPFAISAGGLTAGCIAFLPDFGGSQGMVIGSVEPPDFKTDTVLVECAKGLGMFYTFLSEEYSHFDAGMFKEALIDWGYFGSPESRPAWFGTLRPARD